MASRPKTMREMQAEKASVLNAPEVTVLNTSNQLIKIHQRPPKGVDFYVGAQDISLNPGQRHTFKKTLLWMEQIERLQKQNKVSVVTDTSKMSN